MVLRVFPQASSRMHHRIRRAGYISNHFPLDKSRTEELHECRALKI